MIIRSETLHSVIDSVSYVNKTNSININIHWPVEVSLILTKLAKQGDIFTSVVNTDIQ